MQKNVLKRGFEEIIPGGEFEDREDEEMRVKLGADPTGTDLHLGHAVILNKLRQFQEAGHTVVFIIGDFTARIGDPSGRDQTRPTLSEEEVQKNAETYQQQVFTILDRKRTEVVYNSDWLEDLGVSGLLKLASRYTVARMLERDDFSNRYENEVPIRIHEFMYPLLQGWDSVEVKADFELGGTDQKFNLLVGRRLQKEEGQKPQLIGTLPILPGTDGEKKMSKSYGNHIPLQSNARQMFGKLMSIPDHLVLPYARLLTGMSAEKMAEMETKFKEAKEDNSARLKQLKKEVALKITARFKTEKQAREGLDYFERTVEGDSAPEKEEMDSLVVEGEEVWIVDILEESDLVNSRGEAKRLLKQGGVYIDGEALEGFDYDLTIDNPRVLRVGKHRYCRLLPE